MNYVGDWVISFQGDELENDKKTSFSKEDREMELMFGGCPLSREKHHREYFEKKQKQKKCVIIVLLILCLIAFIGMTVSVIVAIYYSDSGRNDRV